MGRLEDRGEGGHDELRGEGAEHTEFPYYFRGSTQW